MRRHGGATVAFIAAVAAAACQTEQALQPTPADRGEQRPGRTLLADATLLQQVQTRLAAEPLLAETAIRVETGGGVVRLRGVVYSPVQRARAIEIARGIHGARRIDDQLIRHGRSGVNDGPLPRTQFQL